MGRQNPEVMCKKQHSPVLIVSGEQRDQDLNGRSTRVNYTINYQAG